MSGRTMSSALVAAAAARAAYALLRARPPAGAATWTRTNHRGESVTLLAGPAVTVGCIAGAVVTDASPRDRLAAMLAAAGAAAFGGYDDLAGDRRSSGFRGHLGALRHGEFTTGAVKLAGIGATGLAAALVADGGSRRVGVADRVINAALVAGSANLVNLFDLRPGRAIKVTALAGGLLAAAPGGAAAAGVPVAAAAALLPEDLGERAMLGDAGANALGALLGVAAATTLRRRDRLAVLSVIVGLTAASEFVSFTRVIEQTGPLRWLDMLGRRPAAQTRPEPAESTAADATAAEPEMGGPPATGLQRGGQDPGTTRLVPVR
jgi:UDP-N-acetylmuramyl pentapeptide phosphotransferase/UDP-N-acetylglucosamine-1-phosphate transferase